MKIPKILLIFFLIFLITRLSFPKEPLRIISLAPSTTEVLFALGLDSQILAVSDFCNFPKQALAKPKIGTFSQPDIERIINLSPDFIFCASVEQAPTVEKLKSLGFKVYVFDPKNINQVLNQILEIGRLTDRAQNAKTLVSNIKTRLKVIRNKINQVPKKDRPRVFIEIWNGPLMTAGKNTFINSILESAGAINIAYDAPKRFSRFSNELVIQRNPDFILLTYMTDKSNSGIYKRAGWGSIKAIKNKNVIFCKNPDIFLRPGPRIVNAVEYLYSKLYEKGKK